ncbi:hypothetical protein LPUS_02073 [Lasallia pustulata]|nr:hypothetical protein LPUS_02073 [Lasallia pustulata]
MSYPAPRGPCAHKTSLMTPACACLRFMIHPVKAATSFECDGCGHHASFHKMENRAEDEIVARWRAEEKEMEEKRGALRDGLLDEGLGRGRLGKRRRLEGASQESADLFSGVVARAGDELAESGGGLNARRAPAVRKGQGKGAGRRVVDLDEEML